MGFRPFSESHLRHKRRNSHLIYKTHSSIIFIISASCHIASGHCWAESGQRWPNSSPTVSSGGQLHSVLMGSFQMFEWQWPYAVITYSQAKYGRIWSESLFTGWHSGPVALVVLKWTLKSTQSIRHQVYVWGINQASVWNKCCLSTSVQWLQGRLFLWLLAFPPHTHLLE